MSYPSGITASKFFRWTTSISFREFSSAERSESERTVRFSKTGKSSSPLRWLSWTVTLRRGRLRFTRSVPTKSRRWSLPSHIFTGAAAAGSGALSMVRRGSATRRSAATESAKPCGSSVCRSAILFSVSLWMKVMWRRSESCCGRESTLCSVRAETPEWRRHTRFRFSENGSRRIFR